MNQIIKHNTYQNLLFTSLLLVLLLFFFILKSPRYITILPTVSPIIKVEEKIISVVLTSPPVIVEKVKIIEKVKKVIRKPKIVKKLKTIKKEIPKKVQKKKIIQKEQKVVEKTIKAIKPIIAKKTIPVFDAQMKENFIAELYTILNERKKYPKMAKRRKLEGIVEVRFTLCKNGEINNVFLHKSCGHRMLDKSAIKLINSIEFYKAIPDKVSLASMNLNIPIKYSRI